LMQIFRRAAVLTTALMVGFAPLPLTAQVQAPAQQLAENAGTVAVADLTALWDTARTGDLVKLDKALGRLEKPGAAAGSISDAATMLSEHIAQRERDREKRTNEVRADLDKALE